RAVRRNRAAAERLPHWKADAPRPATRRGQRQCPSASARQSAPAIPGRLRATRWRALPARRDSALALPAADGRAWEYRAGVRSCRRPRDHALLVGRRTGEADDHFPERIAAGFIIAELVETRACWAQQHNITRLCRGHGRLHRRAHHLAPFDGHPAFQQFGEARPGFADRIGDCDIAEILLAIAETVFLR